MGHYYTYTIPTFEYKQIRTIIIITSTSYGPNDLSHTSGGCRCWQKLGRKTRKRRAGAKKRPKLEPKIEAVKTLPAAGEIEAEFDDQVSTTDKFILIV